MNVLLKIWNLLTTLLVVAAVLLAVLLVGVRIVGLTPFAVLSGSMEPTYHTGSLIYVKKVPAEEIKVGDPITFVLNKELVVATHRVIEIDDVNTCFYTKGDNNETADAAPVHFKNLIGHPVFTVPKLGYVANFFSEPRGIIVGVCGLLIIIILAFIPDLLRGLDSRRRPKTHAERVKLKKSDNKK